MYVIFWKYELHFVLPECTYDCEHTHTLSLQKINTAHIYITVQKQSYIFLLSIFYARDNIHAVNWHLKQFYYRQYFRKLKFASPHYTNNNNHLNIHNSITCIIIVNQPKGQKETLRCS